MLTKIEPSKNIFSAKIKLWLIILLIQIGSFAMGLYTAHTYWLPEPSVSAKLDYSTEKPNEQKSAAATKPATNPISTTTSTTTNLDPANCTAIKGNVSGTNKIYHVPGGSFYDRTTPEMCFATEAEAQAAGFTKSSR